MGETRELIHQNKTKNRATELLTNTQNLAVIPNSNQISNNFTIESLEFAHANELGLQILLLVATHTSRYQQLAHHLGSNVCTT